MKSQMEKALNSKLVCSKIRINLLKKCVFDYKRRFFKCNNLRIDKARNLGLLIEHPPVIFVEQKSFPKVMIVLQNNSLLTKNLECT
jgi:hypothetical protein